VKKYESKIKNENEFKGIQDLAGRAGYSDVNQETGSTLINLLGGTRKTFKYNKRPSVSFISLPIENEIDDIALIRNSKELFTSKVELIRITKFVKIELNKRPLLLYVLTFIREK
jgi:hypothetical protein